MRRIGNRKNHEEQPKRQYSKFTVKTPMENFFIEALFNPFFPGVH